MFSPSESQVTEVPLGFLTLSWLTLSLKAFYLYCQSYSTSQTTFKGSSMRALEFFHIMVGLRLGI